MSRAATKRSPKAKREISKPRKTYTERQLSKGVTLAKVKDYVAVLRFEFYFGEWTIGSLHLESGVGYATIRKHLEGDISRPQVPTIIKILSALGYDLQAVSR